MNNNPLVSIVIPVYNGEDYIENAILSLINQTYNKIEIIVVDDGSTDNSRSIIKKFSKELKYIYQKNSGQSSALNIGWENAKGDLIGYLSCDDLLDKNCIEILVKNYDPSISVIFSNYRLINENQDIIKIIDYGDFNFNKFYEELICFPSVGTIFTKKVFKTVGGWNEKIIQIPDYEFFLRISLLGKFKKVEECLGSFRIHSKSLSFSKISKERSDIIIEVISRFYNNKKINSIYNQKKALANAFIISAKHHFRSKRFLCSLHRFICSFYLYPNYSILTRLIKRLTRF